MNEATLDPVRNAALVRATLANLAELNRALAWSRETEALVEPGFFRWRTNVLHPLYNGVVSAALPDADTPQRVTEAIAYFRRHGHRSFLWWLDAGVPVAAWAPVLEPHGLTLDRSIPGMAAAMEDLVEANVADVEIRRVACRGDREAWARTFVVGYGFPPEWAPAFADLFGGMDDHDEYRGYVAFAEGRPVATSTVLISGGVAGLYDVAVLPEARGRGIGAAVTLAPFREARDRGCRLAVLHASTMGRPLYERLGFRTVCTVDHFAWKDAASGGR
jgi:ribosomal protein S18 acetylase RimI-like enzyme